jgi:hypothetical protein
VSIFCRCFESCDGDVSCARDGQLYAFCNTVLNGFTCASRTD